MLGRNAFDLDRILEIEPAFLESGRHHDHDHDDDHGHDQARSSRSRRLKHYHDEDMQSVAIRLDGEVDPAELHAVDQRLIAQREGPNILRSKGILAFKDEPKRFVFQGVHMILDGDLQREWTPGEKRECKLVFIGRDLNEADLRSGFAACAVNPPQQ